MMLVTFPVDLMLSASKDEVVAASAFPTSWFDRLTMRYSRQRWRGGF